MIRSMSVILPLALALAMPAPALGQSAASQAEPAATAPLTPEMLGDALSCRSRDALWAFADALFRDPGSPAWMQEMPDDPATKGMLGVAGYKLAMPVLLLGQRVDRVYFLNDWIVTLWPRKVAEAFVAAQSMKRAPITVTEQYYRFIDPDDGPMLGAFAPTGNTTAALLAKALGAKTSPPPPATSLFVGCNYAAVSEAKFLDLARRASGLATDASRDVADDVRAIVPPK
ncbi:hypothetical protein [Sphingomonas endophytica]|uniref:Lipoprotein n=1 Tax=Sphingomonas endophytica TaxID=869719 RepID=A0A147I6T3_9SPHN|nr:hypothetical protein [Sphingomonas endophytica]KTT74675.1 hypothetical protein NS334_04650 [Sphingomonas endophytica]